MQEMTGLWPTVDDWTRAGFAVSPDDMRALSPAELQRREIENMASYQQYKPTLADMLGLQNYRPPVHVPAGFVDWYAYGDELT
jgi:hypothetical protein